MKDILHESDLSSYFGGMMLTKDEKKKILLKLRMESKYPNRCFCEIHSFDSTKIIRYEFCESELSHDVYGYNVYICETCGKEYTDASALAQEI
jgi:hypothetical protein